MYFLYSDVSTLVIVSRTYPVAVPNIVPMEPGMEEAKRDSARTMRPDLIFICPWGEGGWEGGGESAHSLKLVWLLD